MSVFLDPRYESLVNYTPGEQPKQGSLNKLNTNESPYPPSPKVAAAVAAAVCSLNLYPPVIQTDVLNALCVQFGVNKKQIFISNGSDETLAFCFQALCPSGAAFPDLTYGFYSVYCSLYAINAKIVLLENDFTINVSQYENVGRTIFIANPNAPTGLALSLKQIEQILNTNKNSLVVVDEAYVDFGTKSAISLLPKHENLMVVGTFSKSRQLAGARFGYAVASENLIIDLNRIKLSFNPYNVNSMTLAAAFATLQDDDYFNNCREKIIKTRENLKKSLTKLGFEGTNSVANFVFVKHARVHGEILQKALREKNIIVRRFKQERIKDYLRITVGTYEQMKTLVLALEDILS